MKATYTRAWIYSVSGMCVSPIRTGDSENSREQVLRDCFGSPFIQGSSLAGAMRDWMSGSAYKEFSEELFGSRNRKGSLMMSDLRFETGAEQRLRPRVKIAGETGTAEDKKKFDIAHIATGTRFDFTLTLLADADQEEELTAIEHMLGALNSGRICLGGQKHNGYGRVRIRVSRSEYDLTREEERIAWMEERKQDKPVALPEIASDSLIFTICGELDPVLVKSGSPERIDGKNITKNLEENGKPVLPGTSVKGAVRAQCCRIVKSTGRQERMVNDIFGNAAGTEDQPGRIFFEEIYLKETNRKSMSRIRINRFTGGVMRGALFTEEPVSSSVQFRITMPAEDPAGCALVMYALRDLGLGLYSLGSGGSIGRGYLKNACIQVNAPDGRAASMSFENWKLFEMKDEDGLLKAWLDGWKRSGEDNI